MKLLFTAIFLILSVSSSSAAPDSGKYSVIKYSEENQWFVQLFISGSDGWPDTIEKRAYPSEASADLRISELRKALGAVLEGSIKKSSSDELHEPFAGEIWPATHEWSKEWEEKFADWTRQNFDKNFFKKYKIQTDCADAAIALRWIFSRISGLPAGNTLASGGGLMTNRSVRAIWKNIPTSENWYEDRRFLTALDYLLDNTYTHSFHADAYPIETNPQYLVEGTFHLEMRSGDGHTRVVSQIVHEHGKYPIIDLYSNVPRAVRRLYEERFTVSAQPDLRFGGFMKHRWPRLSPDSASLTPAKNMPGYSLEQYLPEFFQHGIPDYSAEVISRFEEAFDPVIALRAILKNLKEGLDDRKDIVVKGFRACQKEDCSPGTAGYENWSTPSRDERLLGYFTQIQTYRKTLTGVELDRFSAVYEKEKTKKYLKLGKRKITLTELEAVWINRKFSSNPRVSPQLRWGFEF